MKKLYTSPKFKMIAFNYKENVVASPYVDYFPTVGNQGTRDDECSGTIYMFDVPEGLRARGSWELHPGCYGEQAYAAQ